MSFDEGIAVQDASGLSDAHFDSNPEQSAIQAETRQKILEAVDRLPEDQETDINSQRRLMVWLIKKLLKFLIYRKEL